MMEFSFSINDIEYEIPKVINLDLFVRAIAWDITDYKNLRPFVSEITGCPLMDLKQLDKDTFELILGMCISRLQLTETEPLRNIDTYTLIDFNSMSFGQFMDIDILLAEGGVQKHAIALTSILYGIEESIASELDINLVWSSLISLVKWREDTYKEYEEFFGTSEMSEEDSDVHNLNLQLMWYEAVILLADDKFLNIDLVVQRPYKEALNYLTYKKHQADKIKLENLKRKHDLQRRTK